MALHKRVTALSTTAPVTLVPANARYGPMTGADTGITVVQNDAASTGSVLLGDVGTLTTSSYGVALAPGALLVIPAASSGLCALASSGTVNVSVLWIPA